ncbi:hypothetical protein LEP1GSC194_0161 [Leptospira alstonii serovar Sichuan str. 79601]|uniref:Uncharacterized protein n=1 Tax=Leptospira alstonii serovar Sichuan str. 79601 TaxID=1218565 RepID=M6CUM6_9LEPT|nr:hypothetical protein LEP1GSC194_0161 [Leptospira alstonii serovar Sichuan str. 79601]
MSSNVPEIGKSRKAKLLSAFFGLDNALPLRSIVLWRSAPGKDGMPLVFSHEIDPTTLDVSDFRILTMKGEIFYPSFVTFVPALEPFELRTVLLIGEFGNHPDNEPTEVVIVGELLTRDGQNLTGQKIQVTPLVAGPFISYAEYFDFSRSYPYNDSKRGGDCPFSETAVVVRTVWAGGVRAPDGQELGDRELKKFRIEMISGKNKLTVFPFKIADTDDNDNNIDLCIAEKGIPKFVEVEANTAVDPRDDKNPYTKIEILSRW